VRWDPGHAVKQEATWGPQFGNHCGLVGYPLFRACVKACRKIGRNGRACLGAWSCRFECRCPAESGLLLIGAVRFYRRAGRRRAGTLKMTVSAPPPPGLGPLFSAALLLDPAIATMPAAAADHGV
jgi:hypothetical protein